MSGFIAVLPGDGWRCTWGLDGQPEVDTPVIGWAVRSSGPAVTLVALVMIGGIVTAVARSEKALRLYHPSDTVASPYKGQPPGDAVTTTDLSASPFPPPSPTRRH